MKKTTLFLVLPFLSAVFFQTPAFAQWEWVKDADNPVMSGGDLTSWDRHVFFPDVLYNPDSSRYEMWFGASAVDNVNDPYVIGFAYSSDGVSWTRHPAPVLKADPGMWDGIDVRGHSVLREEGAYKMWYSGHKGPGTLAIGYATSPDGIMWNKYESNPIMTPDTSKWQAGGIGYVAVIHTEDVGYEMWYTGGEDTAGKPLQIGYARSDDGISWSRADSINPVIVFGDVTESWDNPYAGLGDVERDATGTYHLWYSGSRSDSPRWIGYASSDDGLHWVKNNDPSTGGMFVESDPVLFPGGTIWDTAIIESPSVLYRNGVWHMWYSGRKQPYSTNTWAIGHASYVVGTGNEAVDQGKPNSGYALSQNYPNPFNTSTTISYELLAPRNVTLSVYDLLGRRVDILASGVQAAGTHSVVFDASSRPAGVYFYRLETADRVETRQMVVF